MISTWTYKLRPRGPVCGQPREGALLRVEFEPGLTGYADCHPWPELGDLPLPDQLSALASQARTPLLARSLALAQADARSRSERMSLFEGVEAPRSHASFPCALGRDPEWSLCESELERLKSFGFDRVKLKAGNDLEFELREICRLAIPLRTLRLKLRIDFNEKPGFEAICAFLGTLQSEAGGLDWIDWLEDPCEFCSTHWKTLRSDYGVRLALDRPYVRETGPDSYDGAADVLVLKPAISAPAPAFQFAQSLGIPVAITSYLDHSVGQVGAASIAAKALADGVNLEQCGLITHRVYEDDMFSETLSYRNARLEPPAGTGIGFDEILRSVRWEPLL